VNGDDLVERRQSCWSRMIIPLRDILGIADTVLLALRGIFLVTVFDDGAVEIHVRMMRRGMHGSDLMLY